MIEATKAGPNNKGNYDRNQRQTFRTSFATTPFDIYNCAFPYSFAAAEDARNSCRTFWRNWNDGDAVGVTALMKRRHRCSASHN